MSTHGVDFWKAVIHRQAATELDRIRAEGRMEPPYDEHVVDRVFRLSHLRAAQALAIKDRRVAIAWLLRRWITQIEKDERYPYR